VRAIRQRNRLLFDSLVLLAFVVVAFAAYTLTSNLGESGAFFAIFLLTILCLVLVASQ
jgi:hypothetical protein